VNAGSRQCSRAIPSIPFAGRGDETSSAEDEFPASSISEDSLHHLRSLMPDCCNRRTLSAAIPGCPAGAAAGERELKRLPNERVSWPGLGGAHRVDKFAGHQEKPGWRSHCFAARDRPAVADPVSPGDDPPGIFARPSLSLSFSFSQRCWRTCALIRVHARPAPRTGRLLPLEIEDTEGKGREEDLLDARRQWKRDQTRREACEKISTRADANSRISFPNKRYTRRYSR